MSRPHSYAEGDTIIWGHFYKDHFVEGGRMLICDGSLSIMIDDDAYSGTIDGDAFKQLARLLGTCGGAAMKATTLAILAYAMGATKDTPSSITRAPLRKLNGRAKQIAIRKRARARAAKKKRASR